MGIQLDLGTTNSTKTANLLLANLSQQPRCSSNISKEANHSIQQLRHLQQHRRNNSSPLLKLFLYHFTPGLRNSDYLVTPQHAQDIILKHFFRLKISKNLIQKYIFAILSIWKEQNNIILHTTSLNIHIIIHKAKFLYKEWILIETVDNCFSSGTLFSLSKIKHPTTIPHQSNSILATWEAPPHNYFKLNFDGSLCQPSSLCNDTKQSSTTTCIIIRDSTGDLRSAVAINLGSTTVYMTDFLALHHGIMLALKNIIQHIIIEGDNLIGH